MGEDHAIAQLNEILSRPDFQSNVGRPVWDQLFGPMLAVLFALLAQLLQIGQDAVSGREGVIGFAILAICGLLVVLAIGYVVRMLRLSITREARLQGLALSERRERSDQLWRTAQQLAAGGQLSEAIRVVYLSALYALDERALLHVERGLTNREHAGL